jgi:hypothetical protein
VRTPMIGRLPSCQSSSKNVTVFDQVTERLIESSFSPALLSYRPPFVTIVAARR